jgi:hypothetical protein
VQERPAPNAAKKANVYPGSGGFRYTLRDAAGRVIYDSAQAFRSRKAARADILRSWPECRVSFEVM